MRETKQNLVQTVELVARKLKGQDYFDADNDELIDMIVRILIRNADDGEHISRMLNVWVEGTRKMLHPSDVKMLAARTSNAIDLPVGCTVCHGQPYIVKSDTSGASRCDCARGTRLKAIDVERLVAPKHPSDTIAQLLSKLDDSSTIQ